MINTYYPYLLLTIWFSCVAYVIIFPFYVTGQYHKISPTIKEIFQTLLISQLKHTFKLNIFANELIKSSENKIDIVLGNHFSTIDFEIVLTMLYHSGIHNYILVGKKELVYFPGFGLHFLIDNHIKLVRNWEEDKHSLSKQLDNIDKGVIFIFPEGTRFDIDKHKKGQEFSLNNNLPIYKNLLVPKSKGLWTIYNQLKEKNKLGKLFDMTMIIKNFKGENAYLEDLSKKDVGDIFIINRELEHPKKYEQNEDFKNWLLKEWKTKDILIDNYEEINYQSLNLKYNHFNVYTGFLLLFFVTFGLIKSKEVRYYLLCIVIMSYLLTIIKKH